MGVKSTTELTRKDAELNYIDQKLKAKERKLQAKVAAMSDKELEDALEKLSDDDCIAQYGHTGFVNYLITSTPYVDN